MLLILTWILALPLQKLLPPPPIENTSSQEINSSETNGIKSSDPSDSSDKDNIKPETNSKPNSNTKTESKLETKSSVKSDAKIDTNTNVNTVVKTTAKSNVDSVENTDTKAESNIDSKSKVNENSVSPTIFNQALFASGKPDPNQKKQEKTELKVSLCWETMNSDNNKAFIKSDSDFGQLNFENWDFGSTLDSSRKDVKDAFAKIEFQIKDTTDNKVVATTTGTYDPDTATSATKSLGSYDSSHTYEVSVVNSTVPSPYYVTYNSVSVNEGKEFQGDVSHFKWTPNNGSNKSSQNKYFRLNALEIVYAKDESVADKCFSYEQAKNADGSYRSDGNWNFTYNDDNIFERIRVKDNAIQFPTDENGKPKVPVKAGYKFVGWQFYVAKKTDNRPYTSFDRMSDDDKKIINSTTVAYSDFGTKPFIDYPYIFALIRDNKGVNTFGSKLGTQYCSTNHTFVVFPKWEVSGHTVTFMDGDTKYAQVKVQEDKSINSDEWTTESMPADPSKSGSTFEGWFTQKNGKGSKFTGSTTVKGDISVYSSYVPKTPTPPTPPEPEPKPEPKPTPTPEPEPESKPKPTPKPDVTPEPESIPVPDVPDVPYVPDDSWIPVPEIVPENPEYSVVEQPVLNPVHSSDKPVEYSVEQRFKAVDAGEAYSAKAPAKHLPDTGVSLVMSISTLFVSLFAGFGLSMFKSRRKH
ncbi:InlB B-repeat-containing protein [Gardnerella vaginalis]|uniref:InlB B-repeat-containing protein n=1 Tax=Gardnerella vaginalis TaxID=2702 RepID=UPI003B983E7E